MMPEVFRSQDYANLNVDFHTILSLRSVDQDGQTVGGQQFLLTQLFQHLFFRSEALPFIEKLESLKQRNYSFINNSVRSLIGALTISTCTELKIYQRKLHQVALKITYLCDSLDTLSHSSLERISKVRTEFKKHSDFLKKVISTHKPQGWKPPPVVINFNEQLRHRHTLHKMPTGASIGDILHLAQTAIAQELSSPKCKNLLHSYACSLLTAKIVTNAHVEAFQQLALYCKFIPLSFYELASDDINELIELSMWGCLRGDLAISIGLGGKILLQQLLQDYCAEGKLCSVPLFDDYLFKYGDRIIWIDHTEWEPSSDDLGFCKWKGAFLGAGIEERIRYFQHTCSPLNSLKEDVVTRISLHNLLRVVDAIAANRKVTVFDIPYSNRNYPPLHQRLTQIGFILTKGHPYRYHRGGGNMDNANGFS